MRFQCVHCQGLVAIDDSELGQHVGCGHCEEIVQVPKSRFAAQAVIDDFVIEKTLGRGGMGVVYKAHQRSLDRPVALKVLMNQYASNNDFIIDFVREARAAARLNHPYIVQAYAVGQEDAIYFLAMEFVEGQTLKQIMDVDSKIPLEFALNVTAQMAEALGFGWSEQKLIHRDVKPDNIMITNEGVAKLMDLGLSRFDNDTLADTEDEDEVMGTPQYICPEQLIGMPMDVRGDLYSLGATLYHAITGEFPFEGRTAADIAKKHLQAPLVPPTKHDPDIPASVCKLIDKMMSKHPDDRHSTTAELIKEINQIKATLTSSKRNPKTKGGHTIRFSPKKTNSAAKAARTGSFNKDAGSTSRTKAGSRRSGGRSERTGSFNKDAGGRSGGRTERTRAKTDRNKASRSDRNRASRTDRNRSAVTGRSRRRSGRQVDEVEERERTPPKKSPALLISGIALGIMFIILIIVLANKK